MKKHALNIGIIILSIILGGVVGLAIYKLVAPPVAHEPLTNLVEIPVAKKDILEYSQIKLDDIEYISIPDTDIPESIIRNKDELIDMYVTEDSFIPQGSLFYSNKIVETIPITEPAIEPLAPGTYLYPLQTVEANVFTSEDYITLELSGELEGPFISGIDVIAVDDNYLYLEVLKDNFRYLNIIFHLNITITPVISDPTLVDYRGPIYLNEYFNAYLNSRSYDL